MACKFRWNHYFILNISDTNTQVFENPIRKSLWNLYYFHLCNYEEKRLKHKNRKDFGVYHKS